MEVGDEGMGMQGEGFRTEGSRGGGKGAEEGWEGFDEIGKYGRSRQWSCADNCGPRWRLGTREWGCRGKGFARRAAEREAKGLKRGGKVLTKLGSMGEAGNGVAQTIAVPDGGWGRGNGDAGGRVSHGGQQRGRQRG